MRGSVQQQQRWISATHGVQAADVDVQQGSAERDAGPGKKVEPGACGKAAVILHKRVSRLL
jgi:hypothetical protein